MSTVAGDHRGRCMLDQLPFELVVQIMKALPSLSALWSFMNTSARLAAIFRGAALDITETVVRCTVPDKIQVLLCAVLRLRSSHFPPSLDVATETPRASPGRHRNFPGPAPATAPEVFWSFVRLAEMIHVLAHDCIEHYRKACLAMKPFYLDDPTSIRGYSNILPPPHPELPKGKPYQPKDTGPPSWAEEQLVMLNIWRIQYYYEIRSAHHAGNLEWTAAEQEELVSMTLPMFYGFRSRPCRQEQLLTVLAYLQEIKGPEEEGSHPFRLPCPATPVRSDLGCSSEQPKEQLDAYGRTLELEFRPDSWIFAAIMSRDLKYSPLYGFGLSHWRKFGLALWENKRLIDLGLLAPKRRVPGWPYYFVWRSILTEEERNSANADF
ncbi:hypothetical protein SAMD00023353_4000270 [Rosellinia necatrix]|uniref:F-box domain-containing protein n=1 Tax=Rosellinia necatrix TaxID=77044 RepID=A0A1W2TM42_ROSNE|nr:hypothetical protein SAMD00023353_4000270 [Rosellinia necatrix]